MPLAPFRRSVGSEGNAQRILVDNPGETIRVLIRYLARRPSANPAMPTSPSPSPPLKLVLMEPKRTYV